MSNVLEVNDMTFEEEVIKSDKLTVVDFWAPWCGPCRKMGPVLDEIAADFSDKIKIVKVNTDDNFRTAKEYQISGLPSLLIFKDGEAKEVLVGLMPKSSIVSNIEKHI